MLETKQRFQTLGGFCTESYKTDISITIIIIKQNEIKEVAEF